MSSRLQLDICHYEQVVVPSGEQLRSESRYGVFVGKTVWSIYIIIIIIIIIIIKSECHSNIIVDRLQGCGVP